jgi:hypothetical protein
VVKSSERYAQLFRTKMNDRRQKSPYPDIYYVLFLANVSRARRVHVCSSLSFDDIAIGVDACIRGPGFAHSPNRDSYLARLVERHSPSSRCMF